MHYSLYLCVTFIFISLGLVRLVSLMRKGWVVEPILLFFYNLVIRKYSLISYASGKASFKSTFFGCKINRLVCQS